MLRQELLTSQMELNQLKERGLVRSNIPQYSQTHSSQLPAAVAHVRVPIVSSAAENTMAESRNSQQDAFRVSLDYNQLKSKLKPTHGGHYDTAQDHVEHEGFHFEMEEEDALLN
jgi:hypothetical protein